MKKILLSLLCAFAVIFVSCDNDDNEGRLPTPTSLYATIDEENGTLTLSWGAVEGATLYIVYYNFTGETYSYRSEPMASTSYTIYYTTGKTYEFKVRAANNDAVSEFSDVYYYSVASPDEGALVASPVISNVRDGGLGWVNLTIEKAKTECTYALYNSSELIESAVFNVIKDNGDGSEEYCISGLEMNKNYPNLRIVAVSDTYGESNPTTIGNVTTGNVWQMTRYVQPTCLAFEWDDAAAGLNWTFESVDALTRTFQIQLAKDENFTDIVYDLYSITCTDYGEGAYQNNTWVGQPGNGSSQTKPYAASNTNAAFGFLEPGTTYWLRVKTVADVTVYPNGVTTELNAKNGTSVWSVPISATTESAHVASDNELLFQGFDDHGWGADLNNACGIVPIPDAGGVVDWTAGAWTGDFGLLYPSTNKRYNQIGVASTGSFYGESKVDGATVYELDSRVLPSLEGWYSSQYVVALQGCVKIGQTQKTEADFIITPAITGISDNTSVTISFDAGTLHATTEAGAQVDVKVYRAASGTWDTVLEQELPVMATEWSPDGAGVHVYADMKPYSCTTTLSSGDHVMFKYNDSGKWLRFAIDNILIVKN